MDIKSLLNLKEKLHATQGEKNLLNMFQTAVLCSFSTQLKVSEIQGLAIWIYKLAIFDPCTLTDFVFHLQGGIMSSAICTAW